VVGAQGQLQGAAAPSGERCGRDNRLKDPGMPLSFSTCFGTPPVWSRRRCAPSERLSQSA
jgi:hypothetical protein